jgi:hypothetical protein
MMVIKKPFTYLLAYIILITLSGCGRNHKNSLNGKEDNCVRYIKYGKNSGSSMQSIIYASDCTWIYDIYACSITVYRDSNIVEFMQLSELDTKIPNFSNHLLTVFKPNSNTIILVADGLIVFTDNSLNILETTPYIFNYDTITFHVVGNNRNIIYVPERHKLFLTILPNISEFNKHYFDIGCIGEIDLKNKVSRVIPIRHPMDFVRGTPYGLFGVPIIDADEECIYIGFPGSDMVKEYNYMKNRLSSFKVSVTNVKEITKTCIYPQDLMNGNVFFEYNNFYQISVLNRHLYLFYWKGKKVDLYDRTKGLALLDCFYAKLDLNTSVMSTII